MGEVPEKTKRPNKRTVEELLTESRRLRRRSEELRAEQEKLRRMIKDLERKIEPFI